jgi:hypothetical protein
VHEKEGDRLVSLYNKISMFRWFNTAFIIYSIVDFRDALKGVSLLKVQTKHPPLPTALYSPTSGSRTAL